MKKIICLILLINLYIYSFAQNDEEIDKEYCRVLALYPDSLTNHFPNPLKEDIIYLNSIYPGAARLNSVYAIFYYNDEQVKDIEEKAKCISLANYNFVDSCLMMTNCNTSWYTPVLERIVQCQDNNKNYPIPNFSFLREGDLESDFFEKAHIYVLKTGKGKFLDDSLLWNEGVGLSEDWLHGYTKGLLLSGNFVIYWLEVW